METEQPAKYFSWKKTWVVYDTKNEGAVKEN